MCYERQFMVNVKHNEQETQFEAWDNLGEQMGELAYAMQGSTINYFHTGVFPQFEGKGVGSALAKTALDYAREKGYKVQPTCPFIAAYIAKHGEYKDLVV
jgi:predicted GNAT family acetyltransferase